MLRVLDVGMGQRVQMGLGSVGGVLTMGQITVVVSRVIHIMGAAVIMQREEGDRDRERQEREKEREKDRERENGVVRRVVTGGREFPSFPVGRLIKLVRDRGK